MRNLLKYPITPAERCRVLDDLATSLASRGLFGDVRPLILREAARDARAKYGE